LKNPAGLQPCRVYFYGILLAEIILVAKGQPAFMKKRPVTAVLQITSNLSAGIKKTQIL